MAVCDGDDEEERRLWVAALRAEESMSTRATRMLYFLWQRCAKARPMPEAPPVIRATPLGLKTG